MPHDFKQLKSLIREYTALYNYPESGSLFHTDLLMALCIEYADRKLATANQHAREEVIHDLALFGTDQIQFYYIEKGFQWEHRHWNQTIAEGHTPQSLLDYVHKP